MAANTKETDDPASLQSVVYPAWGKKLALAPLAYVFAACKMFYEGLHNFWCLPGKVKRHLAILQKQLSYFKSIFLLLHGFVIRLLLNTYTHVISNKLQIL